MTSWRTLPEFAGLDLEDTRVVAWEYEPAAARVTLALAASVLPDHAAFGAPTGRAAGARRARLVFDGVSTASGLPLPPPARWLAAIEAARRGEAPAPVDTLGTLRRDPDGAYRMDASFGPVRVACTRATVTVEAEDAAEGGASDDEASDDGASDAWRASA